MAPSRGLFPLRHSFRLSSFSSFSSSPTNRVQRLPRPVMLHTRMSLTRRGIETFSQRLADPAGKVQSYISSSSNPYLNLSIEDHILRTSPPDSVVLFLYINRPSIIIGRNQNPWSEVALDMLTARKTIGRHVHLVRRRSGGGTVFHDEGNMNWSITMPMSDFTRDKNAEMVVRVLRKMGIDRARVNERHDIVLDQAQKDTRQKEVDPDNTHLTNYMAKPDTLPKPLKVSGSAYKLTRGRALHHATTLLSSPNIHFISDYLKSPAASWIQAKGVESVSSPVGNIGLEIAAFQKCLQEEFAATYGKDVIVEIVGDEHLSIPEVKKGYDELQTKDWLWSQTPQFTITLRLLPEIEVQMNVHHGVIRAFDIISSKCADAKLSTGVSAEKQRTTAAKLEKIGSVLVGRKLQDIHSWHNLLAEHVKPFDFEIIMVAGLLDKLVPVPEFSKIGK